mgnify:CR=1 FL=1
MQEVVIDNWLNSKDIVTISYLYISFDSHFVDNTLTRVYKTFWEPWASISEILKRIVTPNHLWGHKFESPQNIWYLVMSWQYGITHSYFFLISI